MNPFACGGCDVFFGETAMAAFGWLTRAGLPKPLFPENLIRPGKIFGKKG